MGRGSVSLGVEQGLLMGRYWNLVMPDVGVMSGSVGIHGLHPAVRGPGLARTPVSVALGGRQQHHLGVVAPPWVVVGARHARLDMGLGHMCHARVSMGKLLVGMQGIHCLLGVGGLWGLGVGGGVDGGGGGSERGVVQVLLRLLLLARQVGLLAGLVLHGAGSVLPLLLAARRGGRGLGVRGVVVEGGSVWVLLVDPGRHIHGLWRGLVRGHILPRAGDDGGRVASRGHHSLVTLDHGCVHGLWMVLSHGLHHGGLPGELLRPVGQVGGGVGARHEGRPRG